MTNGAALRAGVVGLLVPLLLAGLVMLTLGAVGLWPPGDAGWLASEVLLLAATWRVLTRGGPWVPAVPGALLWRPIPRADRLGEALLLGLAASFAIWAVDAAAFGPPPGLTEGLDGVAQLLGVPAAAMTEELLFRGYLLGLLARAGRVWDGVWVSTALFALAHVPNWAFCDGLWRVETLSAASGVAALGLTFAVMTVLSGRIWPAVAFHAAHNLLAGLRPGMDFCG